MKFLKSIITTVILFCCFGTSQAQFGIGMRDNRFVNVNYTLDNHYTFKLEQSLFSEKLKNQTYRLYATYKSDYAKWGFATTIYFGSAWNSEYTNLGLLVDANCNLSKWFNINATINPNYDSGFDYRTCFRAGADFILSDELSITADYSNIPEYRESEDLVRGGLKFKVGKLSFNPMAAMKVSGPNKMKYIRILCNFNYTF